MPSKAYHRALAESTQHHASSKTFSGKLLRPHKAFLLGLARDTAAASMLDYGCGKGAQYEWVDPNDGLTMEQAFGFTVTKFDPAYPPFAKPPGGLFDVVICTHTLAFIPAVDLPEIIDRLYSHATKAVFIAEKLGPRKKGVVTDPDAFPFGWDSTRWLDALRAHAIHAAERGVETHVSFRTRDDDGVYITRYVLGQVRAWRQTERS